MTAIAMMLTLSSCFVWDIAARRVFERTTLADTLLFISLLDNGNLEGVKEAVDAGANVNELAFSLTNENVLKYYSMEHMGFINYPHYAQVDIAKYLLQHGADPNYALPMTDGTTLLMYCCGALNIRGGGVSTLFDLLLDAGADVNKMDQSGHSALYYAIRYNDIYRVEKLIAAGSKCNEEMLEAALTVFYDSPDYVFYRCCTAKAVLENFAQQHHALIKRRPDMALCLAAIQNEPDAQVMELLRKNTYTFEEGPAYTASLMIAALCGLDAVQALEQSGCTLMLSHFYAAASFGNVPVACYLQEKLMPLQNALSVAVEYGQPELTQTFINRIGRPENLVQDDHEVLDRLLFSAAASGKLELVRQIYEFGKPYSPIAHYECLRQAIYYDAQSVLEYFVDGWDYDINHYPENYNDYTLLEEAILHGNRDSFQFLLSKSNLNEQDCSRYLENAVGMGDNVILQELLEQGLDPNVEGQDNPLWEAINLGDLAAVEILIEYGADVNLKLEYDVFATETTAYTYPIHQAARSYSGRIMQRLIDAGARLDLIDSDGRLPKDMTIGAYTVQEVLDAAYSQQQSGEDPQS